MTITIEHPLHPEALDPNRRGVLGDAQRQAFRRLSWDRRKNELTAAGFLTAGSLVVAIYGSASAFDGQRVLVSVVGLAIAAFLIVRAIVGSDALTRDLRAGEVRSVEGAIAKSYLSGGRTRSTYFLDVGNRRFVVASGTYEAAPDAGHVRAYYLPRSGKLVNLERLPGAPPQRGADLPGALRSLGVAALRAPTRTGRNEARAELAELRDALFAPPAHDQAPPRARDPRPLAQAIAGTWSNGLATVTFSPDGSLAMSLAGRPQHGHWWVDANERLHADVPGVPPAADAWVTGDQLTIAVDGQGLVFQRTTG